MNLLNFERKKRDVHAFYDNNFSFDDGAHRICFGIKTMD